MRTTLTLDRDVAEKAKQLAAELHKPLKQIINEALRVGLKQLQERPKAKPYRTRARPLGLRKGLSLDNIQELLSQTD